MDKVLSLRIFPEDLKIKLKMIALEQETTLNQLIIYLLTKAIKDKRG